MWVKAQLTDTDGDGYLDKWETPINQGGGYRDPATGKILDLYTWGARRDHKDVFVEADFMEEKTTNLLDPNNTAGPRSIVHSHDLRLKLGAVDKLGDALKKAPISNPDGFDGIKLHMDLGPLPAGINDPYVISTGSEGGDSVDERLAPFYCTANNTLGQPCLFPNQPGLLVWGYGLEMIKQSQVNPTACSTNPNSTNCRTYYSNFRSLIFRYLFVGHSLALKGELYPGGDGKQFLASTQAGFAQLPGLEFVVTLGGWTFSQAGDVNVGDVNTLTGALLHELAHTWGGRHSGYPGFGNCNPNNQSVLNYSYFRGMTYKNPATKKDDVRFDLSRGVFNATHPFENELALNEFYGLDSLQRNLGDMPNRLKYFAPVASVAARLGFDPSFIAPAKRFCDGSALSTSNVVRVEGGYARSPVDWDYSGTTANSTVSVDINNNGKLDTTADFSLPADSNIYGGDWNFIKINHGLQQIGVGPGIWGLSLGVKASDLLRLGEATVNMQDLTSVLGLPFRGRGARMRSAIERLEPPAAGRRSLPW